MYRTLLLRSRYSTLTKNTNVLNRPNLDIKGIITNESLYRDSLNRRRSSNEIKEGLEFILKNRPEEVALANEINDLKHKRGILGKDMKSPGKKEETVKALKDIKDQLKSLEERQSKLSSQIHTAAESLPNLLSSGVPEDPEYEVPVEFINCESKEDAESKLPKTEYDHKTIGENLGLMEFSAASRISGSSWYYLIGDGALLEQALVQYALSEARKIGYKMVVPPSIVKSEVVNACGFKPNDQNGEQQVYELTNDGLSLIGTAEIPLGALHSSSHFAPTETFPVKYVGVSRSFRAEAGARGKDTKGLYRVHEFTKVELFHFTTPDKSSDELEDLKSFQAGIIRSLGLKAKVLNMPTTDLGSPAMQKYDIEAWMPGRQSWGELTSSSNCGDYQSRRLGIRRMDENKKLSYVHTLNGTAMAVPRVIVAILEQFYDPVEHRVEIPEVLRRYMDDKKYITLNS